MAKPTQQSQVVIEYTDWSKFLPWLTQVAFVLAIALVVARGFMLETLRDAFDLSAGTLIAPKGCGPAGSVVLDLLCCLPAILVLLRRVLDKTYIVRFTWAEGLLALFAAWALLSTLWAGDKFQALVLAFHLIATASLFWAMAQLVRSWMRLRLVAGACMGLLLVYIAQGLMFHFVDVPDTLKYWNANRAAEMQSHGWHEGDFALKQYEQKITNGEMMGFHASPNTFAAVIVLAGVIIAGVGIQRIITKDESGLIGTTFLPLPFAVWIIYYTHCNAAFATPVIAAGILWGVGYLHAALSRKRLMIFWLCVGAVVVGTVAVVGHGLFHGSLPTASLNFRWRYWIASMHIFAAHPIVGVGYGNFGNAYLAARLPAAAEEIKDPHNFFIRALTELGLVGAILMLAWLARAWWEWTNPILPAQSKSPASETSPRRMFITIATLSILAIVLKILAAIDLSANGSWVTFELLKHVVFAALLLIGNAIIVVVSSKNVSLDNRPAPWVLYSMLAALGVFLIHNTIDFSLFEIGPMLLLMSVGGAVLGIRSPSAVGLRKKTPIAIAGFSTLLLGWIIAFILVAEPLISAESRADSGDAAMAKQDYSLASEHYEAAFGIAPAKNGDYALRAARAMMYLPSADGKTRVYLAFAIAADPQNPLGYLTRGRYNLARHPEDQSDIRSDFEEALRLNPNDIDTRIEFAKVLEGFRDRPAAAQQYRDALQTNDGFDLTEPKRLSEDPDQRDQRQTPTAEQIKEREIASERVTPLLLPPRDLRERIGVRVLLRNAR